MCVQRERGGGERFKNELMRAQFPYNLPRHITAHHCVTTYSAPSLPLLQTKYWESAIFANYHRQQAEPLVTLRTLSKAKIKVAISDRAKFSIWE